MKKYSVYECYIRGRVWLASFSVYTDATDYFNKCHGHTYGISGVTVGEHVSYTLEMEDDV